MATRDIRIRYGLDVDRASFQAGEQAMQRIADSTGATVENVRATEEAMRHELGVIEKLRQKEIELALARDKSNDIKEIQKYNAELEKTRRELNALTSATQQAPPATEGATKKMGGMWGKLGGIIGGALSIAAIGAFAKEAVSLSAQMETTRISFEQFTGSAENAKAMLAEIEAFAAKTPFQFPELANSAKQLLAFGVAQEKIMPGLIAIGDIAAGTGNSIEELATLYGKARVQGRLYAEDINQFLERGIPIVEQLAKQFGVTESEVKKLVESGKVGFPEIETAFKAMTSEGGKFFNLMEKQSASTSGRISTLKDEFGKLTRTIGDALKPGVDALVDSLSDAVGWVTSLVSEEKDLAETTFAGSRALAAQQTELNILVPLLKDTTLHETSREEILRKINAINPDVLKGMTLQNIEYGKLDANLLSVNARMAEEIELMRKREMANLVRSRSAEALQNQIDAELGLALYIRRNAALMIESQEDLNTYLSKTTTEQIEIFQRYLEGANRGTRDIFREGADLIEKRSEALKTQAEVTQFMATVDKELIAAMGGANAATEAGTDAEKDAQAAKVNSIKTLKEDIAAKKTLLETLDIEGAEYRKLDKEISVMEARLRSLTETHKNYTKAIKETRKEQSAIPDPFAGIGVDLDRILTEAESLQVMLGRLVPDVPDFEPILSGMNDLQVKIAEINEKAAGDGAQTLQERYSAAWEEILNDGEVMFAELVPLMTEIGEKLTGPLLQMTGAISDLQQAYFNRQLSALDQAKEKELSNQKLTAEGRAKIEADYQAKREALELKAAQRRKQIALVEATIQGALAVIKVIENPFLAIITAAAVAANIATIASQQFAKGGYTGDGEKMEPAGIVHKGEFVIDKATTAKMGLRGKTMREFTEMVQPMILQQPAWSFNQSTASLSPELMNELKGLRRDLKALPVNVTVLNEQGFLNYAASMRTWKHYLNSNYHA